MFGAVQRIVGSSLLLTGAIAIGWALHRVVVVGDLPATSPVAVLAVVGGIALVAVGRFVEEAGGVPDVGDRTGEDEDADEDEEAFEEELAPIDEADLEDRERDEEYGN